MKHFTITEPVYGSALTVFYDCDEERVLNYLIKRHPDCDFSDYKRDESNEACAWQVGMGVYLWFSEVGKMTPELIGDLTHESGHAIHSLLREIGLKVTKESEEAFTYLQGYYMQEIARKLIRRFQGKRRKKKGS